MKKIILVFLILFSLSMAIDPTAFIPADKKLHSLINYAKADFNETVLSMNKVESFVDMMVWGIAKEGVDVLCGGKFDWLDISANFTGWAFKQVVDILGLWKRR